MFSNVLMLCLNYLCIILILNYIYSNDKIYDPNNNLDVSILIIKLKPFVFNDIFIYIMWKGHSLDIDVPFEYYNTKKPITLTIVGTYSKPLF